MPQEHEPHNLGYGVHLYNPEGFVQAVISHFFRPLPRGVEVADLVHEARVALFEQDLRLGDNVPETTGCYWWRVARAVGVLLWEDYRIANPFSSRPRALSLDQAAEEDSPETAAVYYEKQQREPTPDCAVEAQEWFDHYLSLAEGIILDTDNPTQGERDWILFELWVSGFSLQEIAARPEVDWFRGKDPRNSVQSAMERIVHKLWQFFGVNPEEHAMQVGSFVGDKSRTSTGQSSRKRFQEWYSNPENRERHRRRARERMRRKRAAEKKVKEGLEEQSQ